MTPEQLIERVKSLGVEFWQPSETLEAMLKQTEAARIMRIDRLKDFVRINAERLAAIKEELRTLPEQIAKWDAEAARLESQTAEDLLRQALGAVILHPQPPGEVIEAPLTQPQPELYRAGLPPERLRKVWAEWEDEEGDVVTFKDEHYHWSNWRASMPIKRSHDHAWSGLKLKPLGTSWSEVEAMADARIIGDTPQVETTSLAEAATQPTTKPPEDDDPAERAFWRFCMLIDKTQSTTRVKAGYLEGPYTQRDAFKIAVRSTILGAEMPEPPALLDLRTLKVGTVCEATADIQMCRITIHIAKGACFAVVEDHDAQRLPGEASVRVDARDGSWRIPALVPARVVKVPR